MLVVLPRALAQRFDLSPASSISREQSPQGRTAGKAGCSLQAAIALVPAMTLSSSTTRTGTQSVPVRRRTSRRPRERLSHDGSARKRRSILEELLQLQRWLDLDVQMCLDVARVAKRVSDASRRHQPRPGSRLVSLAPDPKAHRSRKHLKALLLGRMGVGGHIAPGIGPNFGMQDVAFLLECQPLSADGVVNQLGHCALWLGLGAISYPR